ncbi:MAG: dephospho-CoA kinase, partial [Phycisphaerae bacterium]|nr:dephospho-CoA kinase [Phycisphaerae bacterium]
LIEAGLVSECDRILFIDAPRSVRLERLQRTRGWTAEELDRREKSQMPLDQKRSMTDHVVVNDGPLGSLRACVARTLDLILEELVRKK